MENQTSWGPVEKAISESEAEFWKTFAWCDGPEPVEQVASGITAGLVSRSVVAPERATEAEAAVLEALEEGNAAVLQRVSGPSRTARVYAKLHGKGLVNAQ